MIVTIYPSKISGTIAAPPSKSYSHRAIILASLAKGTSVLKNLLESEDTAATTAACKNIHFGSVLNSSHRDIIDCAASGTTFRFMTAIAALSKTPVLLTGTKRLLKRPMTDLIKALKDQGATIKQDNSGIEVHGGRLKGGAIRLRGNVSSQFISALLIIAPYAENDTIIEIEGTSMSLPYIDITIDMMAMFGVPVEKLANQYVVRHGVRYQAQEYTVEGDYSNASYFFAEPAITGGEVRMTNLNPQSKQGDMHFLSVLEQMGVTVKKHADGFSVSGRANRGITVNLGNYPDIVQTVACVAATIPGATTITNISHLRFKETDRLANAAAELKRVGIKTTIDDSSLTIFGGNPKGAVINPHNDHRMAMSFAALALGTDGPTTITNAEVVNKSYPGFWEDFKKVGARIVIES